MSVIASRLVGEKGRVLAVEANLKTVDILHQNTALNHCQNIDVYPVALGSENGTATLYENWEVNRGGASLLSQDNSEGTEVPLWKLDELFGDLTIDLIKMDVEGFELEVLKGGINLLKACLPVLIIEVSEQREQEKGVSPKEIADFVKTIGNYQLFKQKGTKERRSKLIPILTDADLPQHDNLVCVPMKRLG
jgi:FkbM family methyltransferase